MRRPGGTTRLLRAADRGGHDGGRCSSRCAGIGSAQVTEHAGFSRLVERGLHLVGALDEEALRSGRHRSCRSRRAWSSSTGLVDLLVHEVRDDPGALPLLSHALLETWQRREGNTLTVDGYRATGGIHGAVAQSAEQLYGQVEPDQRHQLRDLVLRLVSPGVDGEAVRTRVPRRLVAPGAPTSG